MLQKVSLTHLIDTVSSRGNNLIVKMRRTSATLNSLHLVLCFFSPFSLLMRKNHKETFFFYTKTFYSVGSQPTLFCVLAGGEPLRVSVGSVRQWNSCGAVVLSGGHTGWYWRLFSSLIYQLFLQLIICPQMQRKPERWMSNVCLKWFFDDQDCCWLIVCRLINKLNDNDWCSSTDTGQSVSGKIMDEMQFDYCNLPPDNIQAWT